MIATTRQPARIVVDSRLETPPTARILQGGGTIIATVTEDAEKIRRLRDAGAEIVQVSSTENGKVDLATLSAELARRGFNEVTVEAGGKLNASLMRAGLIDEIVFYLAPTLLGDRAQGMFPLPELQLLDGRLQLDVRDVRMVGQDMRIIARPRRDNN
jgi:diaminohydroxyphosphoribosylaminopyrimidine deaminase/5-amino-6-(5-phosphoribosylamino)uracil reductase